MTKGHKSDLNKVKSWGWIFYSQQWRGNEKISPAFGEKVFASRAGWNHIVMAKKRTKIEQIRRIKALPLAKKLLETSTTYQEHRKGIDGSTHFFAVSGYIGGKKLKVIVRSKGFKGKKFFFSVMVQR